MHSTMPHFLPLVLNAILTLASGPPAPVLQAGDPSVRAMWITRFDYRTEADVHAAVERCAEAGFNTLMFQVRGNATAFYRSSFEPWAEQLGWSYPGFDPLATAIRLAHARGLELHAWVNVVPAWWGDRPPSHREHVYYTHPEWFWYDQHGGRQALSERFYVSLNPCLPEVRRYLASVVGELVSEYDIDGLHLDYIRFPNEPPGTPEGSGLDYPRDARTLALFRSATGATPDSAPEKWDAWRTDQVTTLLREIRTTVRGAKTELPLTAALGPEPERALEHHQDVGRWMAEGLLDAAFPMNYTADPALFQERMVRWQRLARDRQVVMGVMIATGDEEGRKAQVRAAEAAFGNYCVFAYSALFDSPDTDIDQQDEQARRERARRREAFVPFFRGLTGRETAPR